MDPPEELEDVRRRGRVRNIAIGYGGGAARVGRRSTDGDGVGGLPTPVVEGEAEVRLRGVGQQVQEQDRGWERPPPGQGFEEPLRQGLPERHAEDHTCNTEKHNMNFPSQLSFSLRNR